MGTEAIAQSLGITTPAVYVLTIMLLLAAYLLSKKIPDQKRQKWFVTASIISVVAIFAFTSTNPTSIDQLPLIDGTTEWQQVYSFQARNELSNYEQDTQNTPYYDYESQVISQVSNRIAQESLTPEQAITKTLEYVYANVDYITNEPDNACFDGTAPNIINLGQGQCDTQSIAVTSILRKMGIAARPVGGCIVVNEDCRLQSLIHSLHSLFRTPRYTELSSLPIQPTFSRGLSRSGGLHAWVTAWTPTSGWITLEATAGRIADTSCYNYHVEIFPTNTQKESICVSKNYAYANACQNSDLSSLDNNGLGLVNEVTPS